MEVDQDGDGNYETSIGPDVMSVDSDGNGIPDACDDAPGIAADGGGRSLLSMPWIILWVFLAIFAISIPIVILRKKPAKVKVKEK